MDGTDADDGVIKLRCASSGGGNVSHRLVEKFTNAKPIAFRDKVPPMQDEGGWSLGRGMEVLRSCL